eukprot:CAMPEP_0183587980 /NCGR_PEP_ID=MMETSP0371-20130417/160004_1 /TAXON_ID=268820 /ORGANISM="Peridinium aciculiferum, Strain PAER-2" /LENGTH=84 /DNA_ID=CAMNT_0025799211 /DNA_START=385 /DNA_END=635 /DNA_ORIENTATION=+
MFGSLTFEANAVTPAPWLRRFDKAGPASEDSRRSHPNKRASSAPVRTSDGKAGETSTDQTSRSCACLRAKTSNLPSGRSCKWWA